MHVIGLMEKNSSSRLAYDAEYRRLNRERIRANKNAWRARKRLENPRPKREPKGRDPQKTKARMAKWIAANSERNREHKRKWQKNNLAIVAAKSMRRIAAKRRATVAWADDQQILMWYEVAQILSKTGVPHQVDHIIPLVSEEVCGFHVHDNLQVLAAWQNQLKGNKLEQR